MYIVLHFQFIKRINYRLQHQRNQHILHTDRFRFISVIYGVVNAFRSDNEIQKNKKHPFAATIINTLSTNINEYLELKY